MPQPKKPAKPAAGAAQAFNLDPNPLVAALAERLETEGPQSFKDLAAAVGAARALAESSDVPEFVTLVGYLGATILRPGKPNALANQWAVLYLDPELRHWLLIEKTGIFRRVKVHEEGTKAVPQDVLWVKAEALIGRGSGQLTSEAQFLSGEFTQARDLDASPSGGTLGGATGVFCEARSPSCCKVCTYRTPKGY